jgi:hypothetical protein
MVYSWPLCTGILPSTGVSGRAAGLGFRLASSSPEYSHIYLHKQNNNIFSLDKKLHLEMKISQLLQ